MKLNEELELADQWLNEGRRVVLATVVKTWGSSPRSVGSQLVIDEKDNFFGSVSGGCIEAAVVQEARDVISDGRARLIEFGVSTEQAWEVGLSCGGRIQIFLRWLYPGLMLESLLDAFRSKRPVTWITSLNGEEQAVVEGREVQGSLALNQEQLQTVGDLVQNRQSGHLPAEGSELFARTYVPASRLILIGAVHISQILAPMAALAGYSVVVIDPRQAFATTERFNNIELIREWPDDVLDGLGLDGSTAVVALTHDPKLDDPAIIKALHSSVFYIGALGSRRTHAQRVERLTAEGLQDELGRIHAPVGLDLGGRLPGEIAVSILAQILQVRYAL